MDEERKKVFKSALKTFGKKHQMSLAVEEMAELQIEILKNINRERDNIEKIIDECADVEIMLEQIKLCYKIGKEVEKRIGFKIDRLKTYIKDRVAYK